MSKQMLMGNEAIARGVYEAGCGFATAYPGTPSTEILEVIGTRYKDSIYCEWACNEKVAFEAAAGASIGGLRAFCAMKHVGMNVAADPIFTMGYAGVNGGLVFVCADDPGCHSSQNEQDNRLYAPHAKIAMLEPADAQECKDFVPLAFEVSERFDTPVLLRMTTRVCHSKSIVRCGERAGRTLRRYARAPEKYAMLPEVARRRHADREKNLAALEEYANDCALNTVETHAGAAIGVIASGIGYQYAKEAFGDTAHYLKLGLTYPLPRRMMAEFCRGVQTVYVVEENEPYLENAVKALGFACVGKDRLPVCGELSTALVKAAFLGAQAAPSAVDAALETVDIPARNPLFCAGCPHRGFFWALRRQQEKIVAAGDIGCYALGIGEPFHGFDFSICMGAGFSSLIGMAQALKAAKDGRKVLGILGDSTFFHSGVNSLIDLKKTGAHAIACILDNSITAMTGHQENPGTSRSLTGGETPAISIEAVVRSLGFDDASLRIVDPVNQRAMTAALDDAIAAEGPFVILARRPCVLIPAVAKTLAGRHSRVDAQLCRGCGACVKIACPALVMQDGKAAVADPTACAACGLCVQTCRFGAIRIAGKSYADE